MALCYDDAVETILLFPFKKKIFKYYLKNEKKHYCLWGLRILYLKEFTSTVLLTSSLQAAIWTTTILENGWTQKGFGRKA